MFHNEQIGFREYQKTCGLKKQPTGIFPIDYLIYTFFTIPLV